MGGSTQWAYVTQLALLSQIQVGCRLLGTPLASSHFLRISPILRALDTLGLVVRCLAYCCVLRIAPHKALALVVRDRLPDEDARWDDIPSDATNGQLDTSSRLLARAKDLVPKLVLAAVLYKSMSDLIGQPSGPGVEPARWTMAYGWMFASSYILFRSHARRSPLGLGHE